MQSSLLPRTLPLIALALGAAGLVAVQLAAADSKTEMAPFKVEAEFGVDGLRIQNSQSVLNQYLLDQHGVAQLQDITGIAPNLFTSNSDSRGFGDVLALRGVANSIFFSAPSVALVIDDVPSGSVSSYPSSLLNVETFVVKAGPQGTDYGRNAAGGVIDIKTRAPGNEHRGTIQFDYGSYKAEAVRAAVDGPLGKQFGYSASFGYAQRDGYIENTFQARSADDRQSTTGRGALYWKPTATLQLRVSVLAEKIDDDASRLSSLFSPDPFVVSSDVNGVTQIDRQQYSFQARQKFNWGSLIATTSRQEWNLDPATTDLDLSPLPLGSSRVVQSEDIWTQEFRFESAPGTGTVQWRAGLFYFDSTIDGDALRQFVVPPSQFVPPGFVQTERTVFDIGQRNLAGYANLDHAITKQLMFKFGFRVERVDADLDRTKTSSNNFRFPSPREPRLDRSQDHNYVSLNAGLTHAVSDSLSVQARTSLARKPAGYTAFTGNPQLAQFDNERIWANEIGLTFGPPKGRFGGSVLGFWNRIDRYQFERTVPNSVDYIVVNANKVTSRGVEAKFMWNPVERVWWDFQAGYTDATFDRHRDANGVSVNGKRVPFIPKYTLRTGVTVALAKGLSANASYGAVGRTFFDERNTNMFSQASYGIVNAQLRFRCDRWTATVYGQNLLDKNYYQFINPEIFAGSPGAPRRYGVQLSFEY
jgi:iron complex outermembrane receptor protein